MTVNSHNHSATAIDKFVEKKHRIKCLYFFLFILKSAKFYSLCYDFMNHRSV